MSGLTVYQYPRGMVALRDRARTLPEGRPSVVDLPYPVESTDGFLDWLPRPILGKVHQFQPGSPNGPTREWRTGVESATLPLVDSRRAYVRRAAPMAFTSDGAYVAPEPKPRKPRKQAVRTALDAGAVSAMPVALVSESGRVTESGTTMALAPSVSVRDLAQRTEVQHGHLAPSERRAAMRARRGY